MVHKIVDTYGKSHYLISKDFAFLFHFLSSNPHWKKCFLSLILNSLFSFNLNRNEYRWLGWYECLGWKWLFLPFPKENRWESLSICQWCTRPAKHSMYCSKQVKTLMAFFDKFWPIKNTQNVLQSIIVGNLFQFANGAQDLQSIVFIVVSK